jgi:putative transposase
MVRRTPTSPLSFQALYVFLVFDHARRDVLHFAVTPHPTMPWVIQQLREATPFGRQPRYLLRDNDGIFGQGVRAFLISCGILEVRTAYQSPWQNPYIARMIGTLRRELLDHVIVLNQAHLERLLREFINDYYHTARPHQGLGGETPVPQPPPRQGELISVSVLGGLPHRYYRAA